MTPSTLIGLHGFPRSGKDTAALALINDGFQRIALADPLRDGLLGVDPVIVNKFDWSDARRLSALVRDFGWETLKADDRFKDEVRRLSQNYGTEGGREIHGTSCWLDAAERRICSPKVVVTDVRFPNEAGWIRQNGGLLVKVVRPGVGAVNTHASETPIECDAIIENDSTIEDLLGSIRQVVFNFTNLGATV